MTSRTPDAQAFAALHDVVRALLAPDGCPWDRAQTLQSLRPHLVEETYELDDALADVQAGAGQEALLEELGDVLLQVLLLAEKSEFSIGTVCTALREKLVRRHPHVFGDVQAESPEAAEAAWAQAKAAEKAKTDASPFDSLPRQAPGLILAARTVDRAAQLGFAWPEKAHAREALTEELAELDSAIASSAPTEAVASEVGDVLFAAVNTARVHGVEPELALRDTVRRFQARVMCVRQALDAEATTPAEVGPARLDVLWKQAKQRLRSESG